MAPHAQDGKQCGGQVARNGIGERYVYQLRLKCRKISVFFLTAKRSMTQHSVSFAIVVHFTKSCKKFRGSQDHHLALTSRARHCIYARRRHKTTTKMGKGEGREKEEKKRKKPVINEKQSDEDTYVYTYTLAGKRRRRTKGRKQERTKKKIAIQNCHG